MKTCMIVFLVLIVMATDGLLCEQSAFSAELLDVKASSANNVLTVGITANMPMIYKYGSVPGQAKFVVDIANVSPEKVEPLIVVNRGAVANITVDKAQISGMSISRITFALIADVEPSVTASPDRKKLTVTFNNHAAPSGTARYPVPVAATARAVTKAPVPPPSAPSRPSTPRDSGHVTGGAVAAPSPPPAGPAPAPSAAVPSPPLPTQVPVATPTIRDITTGATFIDVLASGPLHGFRTMELKQPARVAIDIKGAKLIMTGKVFAINRFGVARARVGINRGFVRIVLDSATTALPRYHVTLTDTGLRIQFE